MMMMPQGQMPMMGGMMPPEPDPQDEAYRARVLQMMQMMGQGQPSMPPQGQMPMRPNAR